MRHIKLRNAFESRVRIMKHFNCRENSAIVIATIHRGQDEIVLRPCACAHRDWMRYLIF